ncbi:MAG TPA: peptide-methionine (S)-S-oxide reductase MsrA [Bacillota bacterium]|nr:peptide-methionine (S)-S-oxide reductase MsrA [Bacillota bacterium]HPJ23980.1 peptide-methionine (S)-S-oxide reductase MsrA [Bacillota bacterium]
MKKITLAGGCFWGVEAYFSRVKGIIKTTVGYTDGPSVNPTYQEVCEGSGHVEAVLVEYDEKIIDLVKILKHFFRIIDPTQYNRQGHDIGKQYRSAIYYHDHNDLTVIETYIDSIRDQYKKAIQTKVLEAKPFYDAETYHQKYLDKNPGGYCHVNLNLLKEDIE